MVNDPISLGSAIGLQDKNEFPLHEVLTSMREGDKLLQDDMNRRRAEHAARQKLIEKNNDELDNIVLDEKNIDVMYHKPLAAMGQDLINYVQKKQEDNPNYNWKHDTEAITKLQGVKGYADSARQSTKTIIDNYNKKAEKRPEDIEETPQQLAIDEAVKNHDLQGYIKATGSPDGLGHVRTYTMKDKPYELDAALRASAGAVKKTKIGQNTLPSGQTEDVFGVPLETAKTMFDATTATNPKYQKMRSNFDEYMNPETGKPFKDPTEFDNINFNKYYNYTKEVTKNEALSASGKAAEQLAPFTPYKPAGSEKEVRGTRVATIKGAPVKTTLIVNIKDESGKESPTTLENVPVEHITNTGTADKPNLVATVTVAEYVDKKKTQKEITDEKAKLPPEKRHTVSDTKRVKENVSKTVDVNPGSNNYNALVSIPGFKDTYIDPTLKLGGRGEKKTVSSATIKAKVGTKGFEGYSEQELIDYYKGLGYTVK